MYKCNLINVFHMLSEIEINSEHRNEYSKENILMFLTQTSSKNQNNIKN